MGRTVASASMSLDGFVAHPDDTPGALFDWYAVGEVAVANAGDLPPFSLTPASAEYWSGWTVRLGALVVGRRLFDLTDGWSGTHPLGVPFVVLTHEEPTGWAHAHTGNASFVTTGIEDAVARARELAGDQDVGLAAGTITGQALAAGLVDEGAIDLVPVVLGAGRRYFEGVAPQDVRLGDPTTVIRSARVMHCVFPVLR